MAIPGLCEFGAGTAASQPWQWLADARGLRGGGGSWASDLVVPRPNTVAARQGHTYVFAWVATGADGTGGGGCGGRCDRRRGLLVVVAGCGPTGPGRGCLWLWLGSEQATSAAEKLVGTPLLLVLVDDSGSTLPWWWGGGLAGTCRWCRGGASGRVELLLVRAVQM
jgi:hypothetical protein